MARLISGVFALLFVTIPLTLSAGQNTATRLGTDTEAPPQRLALLVGNSNYQSLNHLKNPSNDVHEVASKLSQLGFQTYTYNDLNHDQFVEALSQFQNRIEPGGIALFYYSGHGMQFGGTNYLIPVNMSSAANAITLQGTGIPLPLVRNALSNAKLGLIILDACRSLANFAAKGPIEGLAPFFARGVFVAYAADEGQAASDNDAENLSLFTKFLTKELDQHDETLCQLFESVRVAVDLASGHVQFPFVYDGVIGEFVFNRTITGESQKLAAAWHGPGDKKVWTSIQNSDDPNDYAAYLSLKGSDPANAKDAQERLSALMSETVKAVGVVPLDVQTTPEIVPTMNQAERLFYEGAYPEALKTYEKIAAIRQSDVALLHDYATCLLHVGNYDEAIKYFSKAIDQNPKFPWAYYNRGVAHHLKGDLEPAMADYLSALDLRPDYARGYNSLALAKRDAGDFGGAEHNVQEAINRDPHYAPAFFNGAKIFSHFHDIVKAGHFIEWGNDLVVPFKNKGKQPDWITKQ